MAEPARCSANANGLEAELADDIGLVAHLLHLRRNSRVETVVGQVTGGTRQKHKTYRSYALTSQAEHTSTTTTVQTERPVKGTYSSTRASLLAMVMLPSPVGIKPQKEFMDRSMANSWSPRVRVKFKCSPKSDDSWPLKRLLFTRNICRLLLVPRDGGREPDRLL